VECFAEEGKELMIGDVLRLVAHLGAGNLCLIPSDSAYSLSGIPVEPDLTTDLDKILKRRRLEMSLAFGTFRLVQRYVTLTPKAESFFGTFAPGGLTFVAPATSEALAGLSRSRLHASGTIGVRLTGSLVETQISNELDLPITTTPVRRDERPVSDPDDALAFSQERIASLGLERRRLALVRGVVPWPGRVSTVVEEFDRNGLPMIRIIREGAIRRADIERVARECRYVGVEVGRADAQSRANDR
jgi:tRNA A37 threonylcarbamoyladenosine synthetase subunit TsaC/SUA5/YrdC